MRLTFDSNVLVYAVDVDAGEKHTISLDLIGRAAGADCVFTLQSLAEFFYVVTRKAGLEPARGAAIVDDWRAVFPVASAGATTLVRAMAAVDQHSLSFWDAMIWATAREAGCHLLVSEDLQDGRSLEGVSFVNPFLPHNYAVIAGAMAGGS